MPRKKSTAATTKSTTKAKPKTKKAAITKKKPAAKTPVQKMYVGPTIVGFAIQNRVYTDIPEAAKEELKKDPELSNLFIDIKDYPKADQMIREETGYIFSAYMKALALKSRR